MQPQFKGTFECDKDANYSYKNVLKLIKATQSETGKVGRSDLEYKAAVKITLLSSPLVKGDESMR